MQMVLVSENIGIENILGGIAYVKGSISPIFMSLLSFTISLFPITFSQSYSLFLFPFSCLFFFIIITFLQSTKYVRRQE
jgi:hypothetical protein